MAQSSDDIRNRLEEARRMNIDEMRQLERYVYVCMCMHSCMYVCVSMHTSSSSLLESKPEEGSWEVKIVIFLSVPTCTSQRKVVGK